jgi:hypothetical protein
VSTTVTVNEPLPVLPAASRAEQLTVVVPNGKVEPEAGLHVTGGFGVTASVAVAVNLTVAPDGPVASTVMFRGTETTGRVVSCTVMLKPAVPVLPAASRAVQVTLVVPTGKLAPEGGTQVTAGLGDPASLAVAVKLTTAPPGPVASRVMLPGTITTGAVVS